MYNLSVLTLRVRLYASADLRISSVSPTAKLVYIKWVGQWVELIECEHTSRLRNRIGIKITNTIINENETAGYCISGEFI